MRIYIIGNDGITLCHEAPATVNEGEIAVASREDLHAAPLSGKRLLALWNARASAKGALSVDPGNMLKAGTTLVRQWRGHTHTVLVHKGGLFEHEGQRYRSLTVIAERITGAHWSGPRFLA